MAASMAMTPSDLSDSEDDKALQPSDEDVLREEEDTDRLLQPANRGGITSLFKDSERDPNQPRPFDLSRKELRRQRRRERRARRRRGKAEDEGLLMYQMEEGDPRTSDDSSSVSSDETPADKKTSKMTRRSKIFNFLILPISLSCLFLLLLLGAYKMSGKTNATTDSKRTLRSNGTHTFGPTTILISLDGFRADFLTRGITPTLNDFISDGVSPRYMLPSFPSVTFPNHWTLVTGLYPESHGVVGNTFWDPDLKEEFRNSIPAQSMLPKWWTSTGAEAIWSTAEGQGVRTAIHMWPGSEAGLRPEATTVDKFNLTEVLPRKVDRVLQFLDRPSEYDDPSATGADVRPEFIAVYVPDVDLDGHEFGPNSTEIRSTIERADTMLHDLFIALEDRNLTDVVNIVVVSDHGMATTSNDRLVQLEDMIDVNDIEHIDGWPLYGLRPKDGVDIQAMYETLKTEAEKHTHFSVYLRENMPERWHFSKSNRIAPLWIIPEAGWAIVHKEDFDVAKAKEDNTIYHPRGLHGYDNEHPLMRAIFVARGPAFPHAPGSKLDTFLNTEVYNIVCDSLEIDPKPNNGTLRLPLNPIGLHTDEDVDEDIPVDLPSSTGGTSAIRPTATTESTAAVTSDPDADGDEGNSQGKEENIETHKETGLWEELINKAKEVFSGITSKVEELLGGGGEEESHQKV